MFSVQLRPVRLTDLLLISMILCTVELDVNDKTDQQSTSQLNEAEKSAVIDSFDAAGKPVEVVFSFDTTGSMMSCLATVCQFF